MNSSLYLAAVALLIVTTPASAQTTTNPGTTDGTTPSTSNSGDITAPLPSTGAATGQSPTGSSETPVTAMPSPVEPNRLDPSAPSQQRLVIAPGSTTGSTTADPADNSSNPSAPGNSYNAILNGAASNNGTSTGTSGLGVTPAPSPLSPSMYPRRLTAPVFTQPSLTSRTGLGTGIVVSPAARSGLTAHSGLQSHGLPSGHAHSGSHR